MASYSVAVALLLTACWTGATPAPPAAPASTRQCQVRELDLQTQEPVKLRAGGEVFASIGERLRRFDVTVTEKTARATLETELVEIEGDLLLGDVPVRPARIELHHHWLEITRGVARVAVGDVMRFDVPLPDGFEPPFEAVEMKCSEMTFSDPPDPTPELPESKRSVEIIPGTVAKLRPLRDGPVVATVTGKTRTDDEAPREVSVVQRFGNMVRLRFARPNAVMAWTDASAVRDHEGFAYGRGTGHMIGSRQPIRCSHGVPLFVKVKDRPVRVGRIKPGVEFVPHFRGDLMEIDLGVEDRKPFVRPGDAAACTPR